MTDDQWRYWEQKEVFDRKCAERAATGVRSAQEVVAELAAYMLVDADHMLVDADRNFVSL
jgi:hypothetical protein